MIKRHGIFGSPRRWALELAIATGIGAFLGVIGPFGSFNGGPIEVRTFYWIANLWIGFTIIAIAARLSLWAGGKLDLPVWFSLLAGVALGALPLAGILDVFSALFWPGEHGRVGPLLPWYGQTLAIAEPCAAGYYFLRGRTGNAPEPISPPSTPLDATDTAPSFADRLPWRLGRDIVCLQMEDHYVRVHTRSGSELILMPLKAAIAELGALEGLQVHRSWWVARHGVAEIVGDARNARVRLVTGLEAPVSRASIAALRAAGWITAAQARSDQA